MATLQQVAVGRRRRQVLLGRRTAAAAEKLWRRVDRTRIAGSWTELLPQLFTVVAAAQGAAAAGAAQFADDALKAQKASTEAYALLRPQAFAGYASDGRDLLGLLFQPAATALDALRKGADGRRASAVGLVQLDMIVRTQVADAGRIATGVAGAVRPSATTQVRMLSLPSCARCVILAGRTYSWNASFDRHPRCDCVGIPGAENAADDLRTNPRSAFESMTAAEQDKVFTKSGAQAIRDGADMAQVVNARTGMTAAGTTTTGTTRAGLAGRRLGSRDGGRVLRLTPERIYQESRGNREEAIRLLRLHGYVI